MPAKKLDLLGFRFGKLLVLKEGAGYRYGSGYWETTWICRCDCGKETDVRTKCLRKGDAESCGCSQANALKHHGDEMSLRELYRDYKHGAKQRHLLFELTEDEFRVLTSADCHYCGSKPSKRSRARKGSKIPYIYNGIDRVDNLVGYTLENCVPCCTTCNRMKQKMLVHDFISHVMRIAAHQA